MSRIADPGLAERRRRQIMDAALACFRRRGFHQSSMHEICAEAALSAGAVYRYFPSKNDIIAAIAEDDRRQADNQFATIESGGALIEALCYFARQFVDLAAETGDAPLVADVIAESLRDPAFAARLVTVTAPFEDRLADMIKTAQAAGELDAGIDAARAVRIVLAALDGLCMRAVVRGDSGDVLEGDVRALLERLLKPGLEARGVIQHPSAPRRSVRRSAGKETAV
jgi:AcrR family transcriptional regulator